MKPLHPHDPPKVGPFRLRGRLDADADVRRYLAEGEDGSTVTLAVVRPNRATDPDFRAAFARRIEAVREADSPYLCPVVAAEPHGAVPWAAAARPDGESLAELLARQDGAVRAGLVPMARGLAQGLADLHSRGAAYGPFGAADVRPTGRGTGLAGPVPAEDTGGTGEAGRTGEAVGSSAADGSSGAARDVYAWAELVTASAGAEGVPLRLRQLVAVCLNTDPELRPSAADLVRMLGDTGEWTPPTRAESEAAEGVREEADSTRVPPLELPLSPGKGPSRRWLPVLAGGLVLATVAATGFVLLRDRFGTADGTVVSAEGTAQEATEPDVDCREAPAFPPDGEKLPDGARVEHATFSPDGDVLAVHATPHGTTLWNWRENTQAAFLAAHEENHGRGRPRFTPDGCGVTASLFYDPDTYETTLLTYDLATGAVTDHVPWTEGEAGDALAPEPPKVDYDNVDVGPDGSLAVPQRGSGLSILEPGGTEPVATIDTSGPSDLVFLDEERLATLGGRAITVWDTGTGESLHRFEPTTEFQLAAGPGEDQITHVNRDRAVVWDFVEQTETASFTLPGYPGDPDAFIRDLAVDADRERVFVTWQEKVGDDEYAYRNHVWDLATGEDVFPGDLEYREVALHPNGEVIAVVTREDGLDLLDPDTFEVVDTVVD